MDPLLIQAPVLLFAAMVAAFTIVVGYVSVSDARRR